MRYIIYGAGAIGGAIGGLLARAGQDVVLIARGAHLQAVRSDGLTLLAPTEEIALRLPVVSSPAESRPAFGDVVILAMKGQDTESAVRELDRLALRGTAIVCAQNGVANERIVTRRGFATYGMCVVAAATHIQPGVVSLHLAPTSGILDVGRYPHGVDAISDAITIDLSAATFDSRPQPQIMRWKYAKLLSNIGNALDAACGKDAHTIDLLDQARAEAVACYNAAGIDYASDKEVRQRRAHLPLLQAAGGAESFGSSSWQSLARDAGGIETDWLNGEIVLLGSRHGVPTPVNDVLRRLGNRLLQQSISPGSLSVEMVETEVAMYKRQLI